MQEKRTKVKEYEDRLRYGNEMIMQLEAEIQQIELDIS